MEQVYLGRLLQVTKHLKPCHVLVDGVGLAAKPHEIRKALEGHRFPDGSPMYSLKEPKCGVTSTRVPTAGFEFSYAETPLELLVEGQTSALDHAMRLLDEGRSFALLGFAGTGKSYILKRIRERVRCAVVAPTNVTAQNVSGQTIHAFLYSKPSFSGWIIVDEIGQCPLAL